MNISEAYDLISHKIALWMESLVRLLPNMFLAVVVLVVGIFVAKKVRVLAKRVFRRMSPNATLTELFASIIHVFLIGIIIFISLSILQLDKAVTSILAGAGILGLALAFAFQDIAANFISGIFILFRKPISIGDIVKISNYMGKVEALNLRDTTVRTFQGEMAIIPNRTVFQNPIENYSLLGKRRFDLEVGVSYGEDLERVKEVTLEAVKNIEGLSREDEITMFYTAFSDSSINFIIRMWVSNTEQPEFLKVGSDAIINIKKAYDAHHIIIPFPIRTLDFGIKGGKTLEEMNVNIAGDNK